MPRASAWSHEAASVHYGQVVYCSALSDCSAVMLWPEQLPSAPHLPRSPGMCHCYGFQISKYVASFVQNDAGQDKEFNICIGLAVMTFVELKGMAFTSKKVSLRERNNVYSAMVLSVLLYGAAESWALSKTQQSRLRTLRNSWLRFITRDTVGSPDSIFTKDLMEKTHSVPSSLMINAGFGGVWAH